MSAALYHEAIKDLARADHGHGHLVAADYVLRLDNPLCGDRIELQIRLVGDRIAELSQITKGCLLCRASASLLALRGPGQRIADVAAVRIALQHMLEVDAVPPEGWPELAAFVPVRAHPSRRGCVLLPFAALQVNTPRRIGS